MRPAPPNKIFFFPERSSTRASARDRLFKTTKIQCELHGTRSDNSRSGRYVFYRPKRTSWRTVPCQGRAVRIQRPQRNRNNTHCTPVGRSVYTCRRAQQTFTHRAQDGSLSGGTRTRLGGARNSKVVESMGWVGWVGCRLWGRCPPHIFDRQTCFWQTCFCRPWFGPPWLLLRRRAALWLCRLESMG